MVVFAKARVQARGDAGAEAEAKQSKGRSGIKSKWNGWSAKLSKVKSKSIKHSVKSRNQIKSNQIRDHQPTK
jgi:hypothetical protein